MATQDQLDACDSIIVVAGMEGALPSVVGGLTGKLALRGTESGIALAVLGGVLYLLAVRN